MNYIKAKCRFIITEKNDVTIDELNRGKFKFIENIVIGGDNDYIVVDIVRNEWTFGEFGYEPFFDSISLNSKYSDKNLSELVKYKYAYK